MIELKAALKKRAYPDKLLSDIPYDSQRRQQLLAKFRNRDRSQPSSSKLSSNVLVFKCPYGQHLKHIGIGKEYRRLIGILRAYLGLGFMQDVRMYVAHPVTKNLFMQTLRYNYISNANGI